ncbi:MAG: ImmA/IrrE family metallo-endopeptidase [Clostridiales bacterium]|nr:ImmA/IrrE family metallo-endopeptidase [Clostridiales bacterium]
MTMDVIHREAMRIKRRYADTNLVRLCKAMGITLLYEPMGVYEGTCKGFFLVHSRRMIITINSDLPEEQQYAVLAHELGHAVLHRKSTGINAFHDVGLYDDTSRLEYEANIFAAELLLEDGEVLELLNEGMPFFDMASTLCVPVEMLDFKFRTMKRRAYKVINPPLMAKGDFLKKTGV